MADSPFSCQKSPIPKVPKLREVNAVQRTRPLSFALLAAFTTIPALAADNPPPITGFFQSEAAYTYPETGHWSRFRNLVEAGTEGETGENLAWKVSARVAYDPVYDRGDFYPHAVRDDLRFEADWRETYLDWSAGDIDLRIGRQQIVWGEMVGLFFADVVSAKDLRQFVAQDFDMLRIPQWALRAEHFAGDLHSELVWIPYMTYDDIGEPGGAFYPFRPPVIPGVTSVITNEEEPHDLDDSAGGLRVGYLHEGWDFAGFYYTSRDAGASFSRAAPDAATLVFTPEHLRIHQLGGTLGKDFESFVLKVEAIHTWDRGFSTSDAADSDGLARLDLLDYVVSLEWVLENELRVNAQFFQRYFTNYDDDIGADRTESGVTLYATRDIGDWSPELTLIVGANRGDWMARPRLMWRFAEDWRAAAGFDLFGGDEDGLFGQYDDQDRAYGELRYTF